MSKRKRKALPSNDNFEFMLECYDEQKAPLGIVFARNCEEVLEKMPTASFALRVDHITRRKVWHRLREPMPVAVEKEEF